MKQPTKTEFPRLLEEEVLSDMITNCHSSPVPPQGLLLHFFAGKKSLSWSKYITSLC